MWKLKKSKYLLTLALIASMANIGLPKNNVAVFPYQNSSQSINTRVEDLLSRMTLEEKIGQLNQQSGWRGDNMLKQISQIKSGQVGSLLNVDPKDVNNLQKAAVEGSRLGIPLLIARDVIHGYRTIFPIPLGMAATFDTILVEKSARIAAIEAASDGIRWTFSPMVDISRNAHWGRIAESFGEDVYLSRKMGRAMIRGYQTDTLSNPTSIAACAKHFVGYGATEDGKDYNSTYIPERQMREIYLPPFKDACDAGVLTYMSAFNDNDGIPASGNRYLLTDVLRKEWGFDGFVVSDWGSIGEMVNHGFCKDSKSAAEQGFNAGVDMEMVSGLYSKHIEELLKEGKIKIEDVDNSVRSILKVKFLLGLFENPYTELPKNVFYSKDHLTTAYEMALKSAILLKNDGILPLKKDITILITGPMANAAHDQLGTWTLDGEKNHTITLLDAFRKQWGKDLNIIYEPGLTYSRSKSKESINNAVKAASKADVIISVIGEEAILSGEAHSLATLNLVGYQTELIDALSATGKPLVTVVMAGRPLAISKEVEKSDAVIYSFHPGTMGGAALSDIIMGKESPCGKTPVSFPKSSGQTPIYYSCKNTGRPASGSETLLYDIELEAGQTSLGCTNFWLDDGFGPLYPFGYGLSYGNFEYYDIKTDSHKYKKDDVIRVSARVKNTGKYKATDIAQLYIRDNYGSVTRPVKELKGICRVTLSPGESTTVNFEIPVSELAFYGVDMKYGVEAGKHMLGIGSDSTTPLNVDFEIE